MKTYYLTQLAFWFQQILVIHLEDRRKDHYQMLVHHVTTVALLFTSYGFRLTRVGNVILVCMDLNDILLTKMLKYLGFETACNVGFAVFVLVWILARHWAYITVAWGIWVLVPAETMPWGVYSLKTGEWLSGDSGERGLSFVVGTLFQPFVSPEAETVEVNDSIKAWFFGMLFGLQCLILAWLVLIIRLVVRVIRGDGVDDTRSEDGEEDEEVDLKRWERDGLGNVSICVP
ncbi:hypothetical protein PRZ48_010217 [Zasmidium cellare]|uniref:TLC domain-containing protein n=1 Tax=Zasmidium cellare TaxID=395010 RepID=A0ABR0EDX4_ZASCE|nr:hypothetical protein PRZ48_010217 [Zasmidium cellare]